MVRCDPGMQALPASDAPYLWRQPSDPPFRLAGFPWFDQDGVFRRLPLTLPEELPQAVDALANCPAGGQVSFRTDSPRVAVRVSLAGPANMVHMPATGQCGFDLYTGPPRAQRFHTASKYDHRQTAYELVLFEHPDAVPRTFTLNFPLYQGVMEAQIGLVPGARVGPPPPYSLPGRVVIYGTSITQGGCASRPGMAYTNVLSRALNVEIVNLGFSGSGKGEPAVCRAFAQIPNPLLYVLDYEANAKGGEPLMETLPQNIRILREAHRDVPILILSRIAFARDLTHAQSLQERERSRDLQSQLVATLRQKGDPQLHFLDGSTLLGADFDECTVDGVHPTDLGFMRLAKGLEPEIVRILLL